MDKDCSDYNKNKNNENNRSNYLYGNSKYQNNDYVKQNKNFYAGNTRPGNFCNFKQNHNEQSNLRNNHFVDKLSESYENKEMNFNSYRHLNSKSNDNEIYLKENISTENKDLHKNFQMDEDEIFTVSLSTFYIKNFLNLDNIKKIKYNINHDKNNLDKQELFQLKIEINKRLNQLNNDFDMISNISKILNEHNNNFIFIDIFVTKLIEQSLIQVSRYQESYKQYAFLFKLLYSQELFFYYKYKLFTTKTNEEGTKGIYSVYFGFILECEMLDEAWSFIAGILNGDKQEQNFVVIETYLNILSKFLNFKIPKYFRKLLKYIKMYVVDAIEKAPLKFRIESKIAEFLT